MEDHIRAIEKHAFKNPVDLVVVDQSYIPQSILDKYAHMNSYPIQSAGKGTFVSDFKTKHDLF